MRRPSASEAFVVIVMLAACPSRSETNVAAPLSAAVGRLRAGAYLEPDHRAVSSLLAEMQETPEMALLAGRAAREEASFWRAKPLESPAALIRALEDIVNASASPTASGRPARGRPRPDLSSLHLPNFDGSGATGRPSLAFVPASPPIGHVHSVSKEASSSSAGRAVPSPMRSPISGPIQADDGWIEGRGILFAASETLTALGDGAVDLAAATMALGLAGVTSGAFRESLLSRAQVDFYDNALSSRIGGGWGGERYAQGKADLRLDPTKRVQNVGSEMKGQGKPIAGAALQGGVNFADNIVPLLANMKVLGLFDRMGLIGRTAVAAAGVKWSWQGGWNFGSAADEFGRAAAGYDEKAPATQERLYASVENVTEQSLNLPLLLGSLRSVFNKRASALLKESAAWKPEIVPDRGYAGMLDHASRTLDGAASRPEIVGRGEAILAATQKTAPATYAHMVRVSLVSGLIALHMGFSMNAAQEVEWAARMHDVGKLDGAIQELVVKQGSLTSGERSVVQQHAARGALLLSDSPGERAAELRHARRAALDHHEYFNGQGYPNGLSGSRIPLEARITTVADVYDALMENRPYRKALSSAQALDIMSGQKERFDPVVWKNFREVLSPTAAKGK